MDFFFFFLLMSSIRLLKNFPPLEYIGFGLVILFLNYYVKCKIKVILFLYHLMCCQRCDYFPGKYKLHSTTFSERQPSYPPKIHDSFPSLLYPSIKPCSCFGLSEFLTYFFGNLIIFEIPVKI